MTVVHLRKDTKIDGWLVLQFSYDPDVINMIKTFVPSWNRSYDPERRRWSIGDEFGENLAKVLQDAGHKVVGAPEAPKSTESANWAEVLFRRVGVDRQDAIFRALTKVLHPDNPLTGDTVLQRELNSAREELR